MVSQFSMFNSLILSVNLSMVAHRMVLIAVILFNSLTFIFFKTKLPTNSVDCLIVLLDETFLVR